MSESKPDPSTPVGETPAPQASELPPQTPTWKEPVFRTGIAVGAGLVVIGIACASFIPLAPTVSFLVICSGLGILFGAFGSTAVVRHKGGVVAGVAATAAILLFLIDHLMADDLVRLRVDGDVRGARLDLVGDETYPAADHGTYFEFVVIAREVKSQRLTLIVTLPTDEAVSAQRSEVLFECVPGKAVGAFLGSGKTLQWRFERQRGRLLGVAGGTVSSGPCKEAEEPALFSSRDGFSLIQSAQAADLSRQLRRPLGSVTRDLKSDSAVVRQEARKDLASRGVSSIPPLMEEWRRNPTDYRVKLGACVALAELLRGNKAQRAQVSGALTLADLRLLVAAAADPDRTVRIYASEFLYDLSDPRVAPLAQAAFAGASADGKYNLVLVLRGTMPALSATEKKALAESLSSWRPSVGAQTRAEIDKVLSATERS